MNPNEIEIMYIPVTVLKLNLTPAGEQYLREQYPEVFGASMLSPAARVAVARVELYCADLRAWKRGLLPSKPVAPR
jgi:hypothetical protein